MKGNEKEEETTIILPNKKVVEYIDINKIRNDLWDARIESTAAEDERFTHLKQSIETDGLYSPITITQHKSKKGAFSIIDGRRRFEAMKQLHYKEIECFVVEGKNDGEIAAITLIQNLHRKNLNDIERCNGIAEVFNKIGYSVDDVIKNCKRIHNNKDAENVDPKFIKMLKSIGYSANFVYQLMQLLRDLPPATFKYAEKKGLSTYQKILLTHSKLKQHKEIQKDLVNDLAKTNDIKESRIAVYQAIRDLETGALFKSGKGYVVHTFLRDKVDEHTKLEYTPYKSYFEIMKHSIELLKALTGHQITQGEYEYTKEHVNYSAQHRLDIMKTLDSKTVVALIEQLRMVQYAIDSMESMMSGEEKGEGITS